VSGAERIRRRVVVHERSVNVLMYGCLARSRDVAIDVGRGEESGRRSRGCGTRGYIDFRVDGLRRPKSRSKESQSHARQRHRQVTGRFDPWEEARRDPSTEHLGYEKRAVEGHNISNVTDAVLEDGQTWQTRPLELVYPLVLLDAIHLTIAPVGTSRPVRSSWPWP
jgi:hypothetical protein